VDCRGPNWFSFSTGITSLFLSLFLFAVERPELFLIKDNVFNLELKNTPDLPKVVLLVHFSPNSYKME
jgi:hypothetical protein